VHSALTLRSETSSQLTQLGRRQTYRYPPSGRVRLLTGSSEFRESDNGPDLGLVDRTRRRPWPKFESNDVLAGAARVARCDRTVRSKRSTLRHSKLPLPFELLAPLVPPERGAAGVTYERSRDARVDESRVEARDVTASSTTRASRVVMKDADGRRTVSARVQRSVSAPMPCGRCRSRKLALVLDADGELLGATIGKRRDATRCGRCEPPLLPQAKLFAACLPRFGRDCPSGRLVAPVI